MSIKLLNEIFAYKIYSEGKKENSIKILKRKIQKMKSNFKIQGLLSHFVF